MSVNSRRLLLSVVAISTFSFSSNICHEISPAIAINISQNSNDKSTAIKLGGEGATLFASGKYQEAISKFEQALVIFRSIGDRERESVILNNLGGAYNYLRQYKKGIEYLRLSLVISKEIGDRAGEGSVLNALGTVYGELKQYKESIEYYQQSLVIRKKIGDRIKEGATLANLGSTYNKLG